MNNPYNLVTAVTNLKNRLVSEEEAKEFALKNFGELCAYIRAEHVRYLLSQRKQKAKDMRWKERKSKLVVKTLFGTKSPNKSLEFTKHVV